MNTVKTVAVAMLAAAAAAVGTALGEMARDAIQKKWGATAPATSTKPTKRKREK